MSTLGMGFYCPRCRRPAAIYFAREGGKAPWSSGARVVVKSRCPTHGTFKARLNTYHKEDWFDEFGDSIQQCMRCDNIGQMVNLRERGYWLFFRIECPDHGLTGTRRIMSSLFHLVTGLQRRGLKYEGFQYSHPPRKSMICPNCRHMLEPGHRFCGDCGLDMMPR